MSIEDKAKGIIAEHLGVTKEQVKPESILTDDLGAESLDVVELVMAIEDAFEIVIKDEEMEKVKTAGDIVNLIGEKVAHKFSGLQI